MPELGSQLHDLIEHALSPLDIDAIVARRRRHRQRRRAGAAAAVCAAIAIAGASVWSISRDPHRPGVAVNIVPRGATDTTRPLIGGAQRYEINARVEQDHVHGPELCILAVADAAFNSSDCAGPAITNWNWNTAPNVQRTDNRFSGQQIFGQYLLVGTYDGHAFTLTQPPVSAKVPPPAPISAATPCPTPPGGWNTTDPAHVSFADYQALQSTAQGAPDYAGMWMDPTTQQRGDPVNDFVHHEVIDIAFTGDIAPHQRELAAIWGGPLCISQHPHPYSELLSLTQLISATADRQLGLQMISVGPADVENVVELTVVAATPADQQAIDRRFGAGLVKVSSLMKPLP